MPARGGDVRLIGQHTSIAQPALRQARSAMSQQQRIVAIDCETTGFGKHDRIVEFAAVEVDIDTGQVVDEIDTLINPERDVGPVDVHGVTASMVSAAPTFEEAAGALGRRLQGAVLVAHNLAFDARLLGQEFQRLGTAQAQRPSEAKQSDEMCWNACRPWPDSFRSTRLPRKLRPAGCSRCIKHLRQGSQGPRLRHPSVVRRRICRTARVSCGHTPMPP